VWWDNVLVTTNPDQAPKSSAAENKLRQAMLVIAKLLDVTEGHDKAIKAIVSFQSTGQVTRFTLLQLVIATGQDAGNRQLIHVGLDAFEKLKSKLPKDDPTLYYNVATGYLELYDFQRQEGVNIFDCEDTITNALKYAGRAPATNPRVLTNLGNLYDEIGRPVEAIDCYERALRIDEDFGMALGNKAIAVQTLAPIVRYPTSFYIYAHQLYQSAFAHERSILDVGGRTALEVFQQRDQALVQWFTQHGEAGKLDQDLRHDRYDDSAMSNFVKFYTEFCIRHDLYLNTHLVDRLASASIGDSVVPRLVTRSGEGDEQQYVHDIMFRLNEITEAYITARMALVQSQYTNDDFSTISNQTTLVNLLDYSVSNIYVGHLKTAYKEAFGALDKIAVLVNHYLGLGLKEDRCYYRTVWYEHDEAGEPVQPAVVSQKVKDQGYRLFGLYLLCQELCGSKYSHIRNALTHRYVRVYRAAAGPKGTYTFEDLTQTTIDALYKIKCAIMYVSLFIETQERARRAQETGPTIDMPLNTDQNLDIW
jgi:tetratricopeptide (TPR) repeat protein